MKLIITVSIFLFSLGALADGEKYYFKDYSGSPGELWLLDNASKCRNVEILFLGTQHSFNFCNIDPSWPTKYNSNSRDNTESLELSIGKDLVAAEMESRILDRGFGIPVNYNYENGNAIGDCPKETPAALVWTRTYIKWGIKYSMTTGYCLVHYNLPHLSVVIKNEKLQGLD